VGSGLRRVTHLRSVRIGVRVPHPKNAGRDGEFHEVELAVAQLPVRSGAGGGDGRVNKPFVLRGAMKGGQPWRDICQGDEIGTPPRPAMLL
jgi:hypothetical protein